MQLRLLDVGKAELFGLPTEDTTDFEIRADYRGRGWTDAQIDNHITNAITAGAYRVQIKPQEQIGENTNGK